MKKSSYAINWNDRPIHPLLLRRTSVFAMTVMEKDSGRSTCPTFEAVP